MNQSTEGTLFDNEISQEGVGAFQSGLLSYLSKDSTNYNQILNRPDIQCYYVVYGELNDTEKVQLFAYLNNDSLELPEDIVRKMSAIVFRIAQKRIQILNNEFHRETRLNMILVWFPYRVTQILTRFFLGK